MNTLKKAILPILLATIWISLSEFLRNELLIKDYWTSHYEKIGLMFPSDPINGAIWGVGALLFAIALFILSKKFHWVQSALLGWFMAFVMMWVVIGNMGVMPDKLLWVAIPLSLLEVFVAAWLIKRLTS